MVDDVGAVGLEHVLDDAHGLGQISLFDGCRRQLLITEESGREGLGMLACDIVEVVGLEMARG